MAAPQHPTLDEFEQLPASPVIEQALAAAIAERIAKHVDQGTEDLARNYFGDEAVDDWFRADGWDVDAIRAEEDDDYEGSVERDWDAELGAGWDVLALEALARL
jgi:hypothetical protein